MMKNIEVEPITRPIRKDPNVKPGREKTPFTPKIPKVSPKPKAKYE